MPTTTKELMLARYYELCDKRDEVNKRIVPLQVELDKWNAKVAEAQAAARDTKAEIEAERDGPAWLELKTEIMQLAAVLHFIPPRK